MPGLRSSTILVAVLAVLSNSAHAQTTGLFASFLRPVVSGMGGAANTAMGMGGSTVTFASGATNSVGQAMIGAKNSTVQAGMQVASQSLGFMTGMAGQIAAMGANLTSMIPVPGLAAAAALGADMVRTGASMVDLGGQAAISTAQGLLTAKTNLASGGLAMGTGMVSGVATAGVEMGQAGVNMGVGMAESALTTADQLVSSGTAMMTTGMNMMQGVLNSFQTQMATMSSSFRNRINGVLATATVPTAPAAASTPASG